MDMAAPRYPEVARPVVAMAKAFAAGETTGWHQHRRHQLIYAVRGLMIASAAHGTWVVPSGFALWMPAGTAHCVAMRGPVAMRTIYVEPDAHVALPGDCRVIAVSALLAAVLVAQVAEPVLYDEAGRGGHLAALALDEVARAPATPFALAVPVDSRLAALARRLIETPGSGAGIDALADAAGVSRRTLTRQFRRQTGLSLGAWLRRLRLVEAAARHAEGQPLARVAAALGYRSVAAFRAMARREFGDAWRWDQPGGPWGRVETADI